MNVANHAARKKPCILVVDGDESGAAAIAEYLARYSFDAVVAASSEAMRAQIAARRIDLCVLDVALPTEDGVALIDELRNAYDIPVVVATARSSLADRVVGLEMGADDYMSKPIEARELVARIVNVLRRVAHETGDVAAAVDVIGFDGWQLDRATRRLTSPSGEAVPLSTSEFQLLATFLLTPRRVVSREQLLSKARGRQMTTADRSIDLLVSRLRHKLAGPAADQSLIKTVRGSGYMLNAAQVRAHAAR
jgi:two-component system OmpR family response regulator